MVIDTLPDSQKQERRYLIYDMMAINQVSIVEVRKLRTYAEMMQSRIQTLMLYKLHYCIYLPKFLSDEALLSMPITERWNHVLRFLTLTITALNQRLSICIYYDLMHWLNISPFLLTLKMKVVICEVYDDIVVDLSGRE